LERFLAFTGFFQVEVENSTVTPDYISEFDKTINSGRHPIERMDKKIRLFLAL
jgi:hypothetical protein